MTRLPGSEVRDPWWVSVLVNVIRFGVAAAIAAAVVSWFLRRS